MTAAAVRPMAIKIDEDIKIRVKLLAEARHRTSHWLMSEASPDEILAQLGQNFDSFASTFVRAQIPC